MSRQFSHQQPHHHHPSPRRTPTSASAASNGLNGSSNGSSDLYQQLIDSNDLVKELDDIEAISQQISQHAEVLYQNWRDTQPRDKPEQQPQKVASSSTTYGAGVGFPKRSILTENGVKNEVERGPHNGNGLHQIEEVKKVSPLSSPTATLTSPTFIKHADLMPPPEVNGNLKDLVNSFVSTDRAKQAARQTISSTITNQMNKRNNVRSPSPTSSTTSSTFSSRGVSPLRSPGMLAGNGLTPAPPERRLMDAFPTNASIMNSVHTKMPPMFARTNEPLQPLQTNQNQHSSAPVSSSAPVIRIPVHHVKDEDLGSRTAISNRRPPELTLRTPAMLQSSQQNSMTNLHAQHVEQMKKRFDEAKDRISAMQARAASGMPAFLHSPPVDGFAGADEVDFFNRLRLKNRAGHMPSLLGQIPHPELTAQQKAHISERTGENGLTAVANNVAPPKRFGGSVADRVMLFERCPTSVNNESKDTRLVENKRSSGLLNNTVPTVPPWRNLQLQPQAPRVPAYLPGANSTPKVVRDIPISTVTPQAPSTPQATPVLSLTASSVPSIANNTSSLSAAASSYTPSSLLSPSSFSSPILTPNSRASSASTSPASTLSRLSRPASIVVSGKEKVLPKFHFPLGNPATSTSGDLTKFADEFRKHKNSCVSVEELGQILKACGFPLYWKGTLFSAAGGDKTGLLSYVAFSDFWRKMCANHHDDAAQLAHILSCKNQTENRKGLLSPEDFVPLVQDVVDTHPGLGFLKEATEFHSRYVHTVIARIFFVVNRSWSGLISLSELRRSNLLPTLRHLQDEDDINQITDFFSYEHFYVIYCKFWELDKDHDLFIDREDLSRHNDHAISARMIDRIFSGAVTRGAAQQEGKMSYTEFVWFLLAEEDKRAPTAIEYWFRCMDLDGDGYLSMYELEYFYEEQLQRMEQLGIETLPFEDCLCQMLDMIMPKKLDVISLQDMRRCRMTPIFFDTFFNLEKYLDHEQKDPFASQRDVDEDGNEMSDWDRFAAEEYELLVAEEGNAEGMDDLCYEDDPDASAEMQLEQALDENDVVYHDTMIAANS